MPTGTHKQGQQQTNRCEEPLRLFPFPRLRVCWLHAAVGACRRAGVGAEERRCAQTAIGNLSGAADTRSFFAHDWAIIESAMIDDSS